MLLFSSYFSVFSCDVDWRSSDEGDLIFQETVRSASAFFFVYKDNRVCGFFAVEDFGGFCPLLAIASVITIIQDS